MVRAFRGQVVTCTAVPLALHGWFTVLLVPVSPPNLMQPGAYTYPKSQKCEAKRSSGTGSCMKHSVVLLLHSRNPG